MSFTYVIYSQKSVLKFIKYLKKQKIKDLSIINNIEEKQLKDNKSIYYKYLQALSSRATIINLEFTSQDLDDLKSENRKNLYLCDILKDLKKR